jgi:neurotransmitter:Na+ symporter, NSS family
MPKSAAVLWSSRFATYLGSASAAVGLGSMWRFPYLAGTDGGSAFILVFVLACVLIASPLLIAEFALGRHSRLSPPEAAGAVAREAGKSSRWNAIGIVGSVASFLIFSYYSMVAGWVLAYTWKCAAGQLTSAGPDHVAGLWQAFRADPIEISAWQLGFAALVVLISARGLQRGIEAANKVRAPLLLALLLVLVAYALARGDVRRGLAFAFGAHFGELNAQVVLAAIGQALYATGVGQSIMIAYGAYIDRDTPLVRTAMTITGSILAVSLLATLMIFPLVFAYGVNPAQGPELVFEVLPRVFAEMPGGRLVGTLFFLLLTLTALMPSIACIEPAVAWLMQRFGASRATAVTLAVAAACVLGIGSVLSFNLWSSWHPLAWVPLLRQKTFFDLMDYLTANVMLPLGACLTSILVGWRLGAPFAASELADSSRRSRLLCAWLLRYVCPLGILAVSVANLG